MTTSPDAAALGAIQRTINTSPSFPAFTANVQELLAIKDNPYNTVNAVSAIILRDLSLTTQILKVVNSVFYQTYPRQVHTVSSAVMILGFDHLRDLAIGLRLFETFRKSSHLSHLKQLIVLSFLTAIQAQEMAKKDPFLKAEEVFITALLFNIGELIVAYYLPKEYHQIIALEDKGWARTAAAEHVLRVSMEEVGLAILKDWNFPAGMLQRLSTLHCSSSPSLNTEARLWLTIKGAFVLSRTFLDPQISPDERQKHEERVCRTLDLNRQTLAQSLTASKKRLFEMTQILRIDLHKLQLSEAVMGAEEPEDQAAASLPEMQEPLVSPETQPAPDAGGAAAAQAADLKKLQFLYQVMEEVNQSLASQAPINQVLLMILEGIFRGIGFDRVIFSLVNPQRTWITARFGLGSGVEDLLPLMHLSLKEEKGNAFALALAARQERLVSPRSRPEDMSLMEDSFWHLSGAHCFLITPLHVDQIPIGAIYVDRTNPEAAISEEDRRRLHLFRDLIIIALRLSKKAKIFE